MNREILKSKINVVEARIQQIKNSELFTNEQKEILIQANEKELHSLETECAKNIEVINPIIL
ncbi:MAG TPA: hypothetical protein DDZ41_09630 [Flavobacterium sp.]|nr:hypothetical protein [Flavobacterium sp.]